MAVSKAVKGGRLAASVVRNARGQPKIADAELADREWEAATDLSRAPGYVKERASSRRAPKGPDSTDLSLSGESAREKFWKANQAELDYREQLGELTNAKEMGDKIIDVFTRCRTRLLGLPTRAKQQIPHLSVTDLAVIDGIVREALEELAADLEAEQGREAASG
jgi:phage terminase Nu1 subunit (DNA packaging protein)